MNRPPENDVCSICQCDFTAPCQSNCSHWFCGDCILTAWRHRSAAQPCKCPLCRGPINLLVPTEDTIRDPNHAIVLRDLETYNRLFGRGPTSLLQMMLDIPFLLRRLLREMIDSPRRLPRITRARVYIAMISTAVYIVSPTDIIPERAMGIFGMIDDLLIILLCFLYLSALYRSVLFYRHSGR